MRILIADDDIIARKLLNIILTPFGQCDFAENGTFAIQSFKKSWTENKLYDLVLLDFAMPEIHGINVLRQIRAFEKDTIKSQKEVVIIIITAHDNPAIISESFRSNTTSFIAKPIDKGKILSELQKLGIMQ